MAELIDLGQLIAELLQNLAELDEDEIIAAAERGDYIDDDTQSAVDELGDAG